MIETLKLKDQVNSLEQEARMVLPGIQALFGFQLIAVFNQGFKSGFSPAYQQLHYLALAFTALATLLVLTPAAYHRQAQRDCISSEFVTLASRLILGGMAFLAAAICLDFYLIGSVVGLSAPVNTATSLILTLSYFIAWVIYPRMRGVRGMSDRRDHP